MILPANPLMNHSVQPNVCRDLKAVQCVFFFLINTKAIHCLAAAIIFTHLWIS